MYSMATTYVDVLSMRPGYTIYVSKEELNAKKGLTETRGKQHECPHTRLFFLVLDGEEGISVSSRARFRFCCSLMGPCALAGTMIIPAAAGS